MPHENVRRFATFFVHLKTWMLRHELDRSGQHFATWEKKGSQLISTRNVLRYRNIRDGVSRLLRELQRCDAKIIYYGREKYQKPEDSRSRGLYSTVLNHIIRSSDKYCIERKQSFMMILDQHPDRLALLETATKTMFDADKPARCLIEPPFQVESHLYQTIQAADWIAALVGRLMAYKVEPDQYSDWEWADRYFGTRVKSLTTHSTLWTPSEAQRKLKLTQP